MQYAHKVLEGYGMYIIAGLGNPGKKYDFTRHNAGFMFLDYFSKKHNIKINKIKFKGLYGEGKIFGERVVLLKPSTFMNLSGESIASAMQFYKEAKLIVIYDDISLELGRIRIREQGSAGGHNGMKSIIYSLNSDEFLRVKIGVNAPHNENIDLADYVLSRFPNSEIKEFSKAVEDSVTACELIIKGEVSKAMNMLN